MKPPHIPVLLDEVLHSFQSTNKGYFVDCTLGYAGHSVEVLKKYSHLKHIGIDRDQEALDFSKKRLESFGERSRLYKGSFAKVFPGLQEAPISALLADFGLSSLQLDKKQRGFSFDSDRLDMRMDRDALLSAFEVVNNYSQEKLEYIFDTYGEISVYKKLAVSVVETRSKEPIQSAKALSKIAKRVMPPGGKIHPATLMFQAIRIEVNSELEEIEGLLDALEQKHYANQIVTFITFHSLEDRLVKKRFKEWQRSCICDPLATRCICGKNHDKGKMLFSKPVTPTQEELRKNPRSRSAKLRSFRFKNEN